MSVINFVLCIPFSSLDPVPSADIFIGDKGTLRFLLWPLGNSGSGSLSLTCKHGWSDLFGRLHVPVAGDESKRQAQSGSDSFHGTVRALFGA